MFFLPNLTNAQLIKIGAGGGLTQILAPDVLQTKYPWRWRIGIQTEWNIGAIGKS